MDRKNVHTHTNMSDALSDGGQEFWRFYPRDISALSLCCGENHGTSSLGDVSSDDWCLLTKSSTIVQLWILSRDINQMLPLGLRRGYEAPKTMAAPVRTNQVWLWISTKLMLCLSRRSRIHPELSYQFIITFSVRRHRLNLLSPLFVDTL